MRRQILPILILLLALAPFPATAEDAAAPYHPEFNGLNLLATFPELAKRHRRGERIDIFGVYEHDDGRILVSLTSSDRRSKKITSWHLDLFSRVLTPVPLEVGSPSGPGWRQLERNRDSVEFGSNGRIFSPPMNLDPDCDGELLYYLMIAGRPGAVFFLQKTSNLLLGGEGCNPPSQPQRARVALRSGQVFVPLRDGTLLVWPFWQATDLIRINRDLTTSFHTPNILLLHEEEWRRILDVTGLEPTPPDLTIQEMHRRLLQKFDAYLRTFNKKGE